MIFGIDVAISTNGFLRRSMLLWYFGWVSMCLWAGSPLYAAASEPSAPELTVDELITSLAKHRPEVAYFEETTFSSMLTEPLKTRGFLKYTPPSRLEKHVTYPYEERYIVDGDKLMVEKQRKRVNKTLAIDDYPAIRTYIVALRSTLMGDPIELKRFYRISIEGERRRWTLMLEPLERTSQTLVEQLRVSGEGDRVTGIETRAPDGDRSVLVITKELP